MFSITVIIVIIIVIISSCLDAHITCGHAVVTVTDAQIASSHICLVIALKVWSGVGRGAFRRTLSLATLYYTILYYTILYCTILYYVIIYYVML